MRLILPLFLIIGGLFFTGDGIWIQSKAIFAQYLIEQAWDETRETGKPHKPWPWADTWPVFKLTFMSQQKDLMVLQGSSGRTLAFGPGHTTQSSSPGQAGTILVSAHRDTHFNILKQVKKDSILKIETVDNIFYYQVNEMLVLDASKDKITNNLDGSALVLVTCYPFEALLPGGNLRYVVIAQPIEISTDGINISV